MTKTEELYDKLKAAGLSLFGIELNTPSGYEKIYFIHDNKTLVNWRYDIAAFRGKSNCSWLSPSKQEATEPFLERDVYKALLAHLHDLGYKNISDLLTDVYQGRIACLNAQLLNDGWYDTKDGFGAYGWGEKEIKRSDGSITDKGE